MCSQLVIRYSVIIVFSMLVGCADQSVPPSDVAEIIPNNRFPRMVHEYFIQRAAEIDQASVQRRAALKTPAEVRAYIEEVRDKIQQCFGSWPDKTPLNAKVTNVLDRGAYRIENILFESRPGFLVTANCYVPQNKTGPFPGVIGTCGHSPIGKASENDQMYAQILAAMGYVVLVFDPLGQGERRQLMAGPFQSRVVSPTREHLYAGNQQFLVGEFLGSWRAWDGIRALDYLVSRAEVDSRRVGVTGCSGGGTMTAWLVGLERRFTMAAPSCFVTTFRHNLENELPADTEQCPPKALQFGLEHLDFLAAMAPNPVIILAQQQDFFDLRGARDAFGQLRSLYATLGQSRNVAMHEGPGGHGYSRDHREAMYAWFNSATQASQVQTESATRVEKTEALQCTPAGQVDALGSKSVLDFTREKSQRLAAERSALSVSALQQHIASVLRLEKRAERSDSERVPPYRILKGPYDRKTTLPDSDPFIAYAVETEPGIQAVVYRLSENYGSYPIPQGEARAVLYVAHRSSHMELLEEPMIRQLQSEHPNTPVYLCDVRGIGESQPNTCNSEAFTNIYGSDYLMAIHGIMLDEPYIGMRTWDVLQVLALLKSAGHTEVHLAGKGWGALPAAFAAMLSEQVTQVTLKNALISYSAIAESNVYDWPLSCFIPGVLETFDLPDCYEALKSKGLRQIAPWGPEADPAVVEIAY